MQDTTEYNNNTTKIKEVKQTEYNTFLLHCKKNIDGNEAETSVGLIVRKSLFPEYKEHKYQQYRAITISNKLYMILNIYVSAHENAFKKSQLDFLCKKIR